MLTLEPSISEDIAVISGYLAWSGGDSAIFDPFEISRVLRINFQVSVVALDYLLDRGFVTRENSKFKLTKQGSFLVDFSLLEIVAKWAYRAEVDAPYPWRTLQWIFLRSKYFPTRPPYGIRGAYVLDFCSNVLKFLTEKLPYTINDYPLFRDFVMRASLRPTLNFLKKDSNDKVTLLLNQLISKGIAKVDERETTLLFDTNLLQIGERIGRTKRPSKEKTK